MNSMRKNGLRKRMVAALLAVFLGLTAVFVCSATIYAAEVTAMEATSATIKGDTVNLRSGAGTNYDKVTALTGGTEVTVTGQATDSDGKVWYQVSTPDGKVAFVRNDFLTLGEPIPAEPAEVEPAEPEEPEEPVETEPEPEASTPKTTDKYVAVYENDADGVPFWYLHDNEALNRVKIDDLMKAAEDVANIGKLEKDNKTMKTALIVLAILLVVLIVVLVIVILRLKDYMYYEEDEEEEEPEPRRGGSSFIRRRREEEEEEDEVPPRPVRSSAGARSGRGQEEAPVRGARTAARPDPRSTQQPRPRESEQTRRARNVMREDDDLEYEFLNLDDE